MTSYKRGDIVLVPFPFTDFSTLKQRPALVISSSAFNRTRDDVILLALTSNLESADKGGNYALTDSERKQSGLPIDAVILTGKVMTIDRRLIRKVIGFVAPKTLRMITARVLANIS